MSTSANTLAREPKMMTKIVSDMMMVADRDGGFEWSAMELMACPVDRDMRLARPLIRLCRAVRLESLESIRANLRIATWLSCPPRSPILINGYRHAGLTDRTMHVHGPYGARLHRPLRPPRAEPLDANDVIEHRK